MPRRVNVNGCDGDDVLDASAVTVGFTDLFGGDGDDVLSPGTTAGDFIGGKVAWTRSATRRARPRGRRERRPRGTDPNGDGDSADAGEEGDFIDCFEIIQTGTGDHTFIANGDGSVVPR